MAVQGLTLEPSRCHWLWGQIKVPIIIISTANVEGTEVGTCSTDQGAGMCAVTVKKSMNWPVRPIKPTDKNFITRSWIMSMRGQFPVSQLSKEAVSKFSARVRALVDVANVAVVCDPKNEDVIYGFCCYETGLYLGKDIPTLHYIWTRRAMRRNGIGQFLMEYCFGKALPPIHYTHTTRYLGYGKIKQKWSLKHYDPYLIEGALFRDAKKIDIRAIYWSQIPCQNSPTD